MKYIWNPHNRRYNWSSKSGKKPGDSYEVEFLEIMEAKGKKPLGASELTKEELVKEYSSKGATVLDVQTDNKGDQTLKIIKPKEK